MCAMLPSSSKLTCIQRVPFRVALTCDSQVLTHLQALWKSVNDNLSPYLKLVPFFGVAEPDVQFPGIILASFQKSSYSQLSGHSQGHLSSIFMQETTSSIQDSIMVGRDSFQLFAAVFDICLVWYLLVLPSETHAVASMTSYRAIDGNTSYHSRARLIQGTVLTQPRQADWLLDSILIMSGIKQSVCLACLCWHSTLNHRANVNSSHYCCATT